MGHTHAFNGAGRGYGVALCFLYVGEESLNNLRNLHIITLRAEALPNLLIKL